MNYALLVEENEMYPVTYTIKQNGDKVIENTKLKGGDLTEEQIKYLYYRNMLKTIPTKKETDDYVNTLPFGSV